MPGSWETWRTKQFYLRSLPLSAVSLLLLATILLHTSPIIRLLGVVLIIPVSVYGGIVAYKWSSHHQATKVAQRDGS